MGPAVFVEIQRGNAERVMPLGAIDVRLYGDVFERTVAFVVIKNILRARQTARPAHHGNAFPYTCRPLAGRGRRRKIKIHIVGYDQVEPAVAIIVNKCAACSPAFLRAVISSADALPPARCGESGLGGDVGKSSVVIVAIEMIAGCWSGGSRSEPGPIH